MKALQSLVRNGNATGVSIPRMMLVQLGWLPGQRIIVETTAENAVVLRLPDAADFGVRGRPMIVDSGAGESHA